LTAVEAHLLEGIKGPRPERFWGQRRKAFCPLLHPEQLEEVGCRCFGVHADFVQRQAYLRMDRVRAIGLHDATVMAQHIDQGVIGYCAAIGETASFEIGNLLTLQSLPKFVEEPRLASPRFRHNSHHLSLPCLDLSK